MCPHRRYPGSNSAALTLTLIILHPEEEVDHYSVEVFSLEEWAVEGGVLSQNYQVLKSSNYSAHPHQSTNHTHLQLVPFNTTI